jgi:hypothetical protein
MFYADAGSVINSDSSLEIGEKKFELKKELRSRVRKERETSLSNIWACHSWVLFLGRNSRGMKGSRNNIVGIVYSALFATYVTQVSDTKDYYLN